MILSLESPLNLKKIENKKIIKTMYYIFVSYNGKLSKYTR